MKVVDVYESEEFVYNRLVDTWRWGTVWEKVVKEGGKFWMIRYRRAGGDSEIDLDDALFYRNENEAIEVNLVQKTLTVGVAK